MADYTITDLNGRPLRWGQCPDADLEFQAGEGELLVPEMPPSDSHYRKDGAWVSRGEAPSPTHAWDPITEQWVEARTLEQARAGKAQQINQWRDAEDERFSHEGLWFDADPASWKKLTGVQSYVSDFAALPSWFPGFWKSENNTYWPVPDIAAWRLLYASALERGALNFQRSEQLKAYLHDENRTMTEIDNITWDMEIPTAI